MSKEALATVIGRSINDRAFRAQLRSDPGAALRGYDLTAEEISAIGTRDAARLSALGVDQRMSKAFTFEPGVGGSSVLVAGTGDEPRDVAPVWIGDTQQEVPVHTYSGDDNAGPAEALVAGEPHDDAPAWIGDYTGNLDASVTAGEPNDVGPTDIGDTLSGGTGPDLQQ